MSKKKKKKKLFSKFNICLFAVIIGFGGYMLGFRMHRAFRCIVPGKVYSAKQPSADQLQKWIDKYGFKTIINLRGYSPGNTPEEVAVAEKNNVRMVTLSWSAHNTPRHPLLKRFIKEIETCQTPILIHCHSGIDRSGTAASMAAMEIGDEDYYSAKKHSFVPPGPWKRKKRKKYVHVSDVFVEFEKYCLNNKVQPDWELMKDWANTTWQSYYSFYNVEYTLPKEIITTPDSEQMLKVSITNKADRDIPAGINKFKLFAYLGDSISQNSAYRLLGPETELPSNNILPNETITIEQKITAPAEPGRYEVHFNLDTEWGYNFEHHGSAIGTLTLIVTDSNNPIE